MNARLFSKHEKGDCKWKMKYCAISLCEKITMLKRGQTTVFLGS